MIYRVGSAILWLAIACFAANSAVAAEEETATQEAPQGEGAEDASSDADDPARLSGVTVTGEMSRYSALKSDTPIMETARSVSIETAATLRERGALELADAYLYSAGVFGETYGFATRGDWVKVRGLDVPEYRDSLQALFGNYNNTRPHVYTLEQVEILKGPASVLYGQGSPGGLVNVVSKRPRADLRSEVVLQLGTFDHMQLATDFGGAMNESGSLLYRVTAVYRDAGTQVDFVENDAWVFAPSVTWSPNARTNLTLLANFQESSGATGEQFVPIYGTLYPAPNGEFLGIEDFYGEPGFDHYNTETQSLTLLADHMINATWSIEATARWTDGAADYNQAWPAFIGGTRYVFNADGSLYRDGMVPRTFYASDATSEQLAMDTRLRADFTTGSLEHELMIGLQYQDVTTENDLASAYALGYDLATGQPDTVYGDAFWINLFNPQYGSIPSADILDDYFIDGPETNTRDTGLYINDQISYDNWRFTAGVRFDDVSTDTGTVVQEDDAVSTSVGALYWFDSGFAPYVSYAESFTPVIGVDNVTQEPLKPQEGQQVEVGVKYQPVGSPTFITVAAFDIEQSNLSNPFALPNAPSQQEGVANIQGIEIESKTQLGDFSLEVNASKLDTESAAGFQFASVPENQASAWLGYAPGSWQGFKAGIGLRYVGESFDGADDIRTPSYTLADLMVGYEMRDWDFRLNVRNAADKEYVATCLARGDCFWGERRTIVGTVVYRFD
ncbi:MAG TPA: TonB-dependent siderophore receptor [Gammaproteobacteria bacterium]